MIIYNQCNKNTFVRNKFKYNELYSVCKISKKLLQIILIIINEILKT